MRLTRILGTVAAVAALALPATPAQAVNTPAYTFTVDCNRASATSTSELGVTLPSGNYLVTVAGACTFTHQGVATVPVDTCVHPVSTWGYPCVDTGADVNGVPRDVCVIGVGIVNTEECVGRPRGVYLPFCYGAFTVVVNEQCLTTVTHNVGFVSHGGGAMTARVLDSVHGDNLGTFTVTAVWTPL